jgi:hypothetical protein
MDAGTELDTIRNKCVFMTLVRFALKNHAFTEVRIEPSQ